MIGRIARLVRHRWADDAGHAISKSVADRLAQHIAASELQHSGEIRMCIEGGLPNALLLQNAPMHALLRQRALDQFSQLRIWDTAHNNGVLIYLLLAERAIEIVADRGLNTHVPPAQWEAILFKLSSALKNEQFEAGLVGALDEVSEILRTLFPVAAGARNANELSDRPVLL